MQLFHYSRPTKRVHIAPLPSQRSCKQPETSDSSDTKRERCASGRKSTARSDSSKYSKVAPLKSSTKLAVSQSSCKSEPDSVVIRPAKVPANGRPSAIASTPKLTTISDDKVFQLLNSRIASSTEHFIFCTIAKRFGLEVAVFLAAKFGWEVQRPLRALRRGDTKSLRMVAASPKGSKRRIVSCNGL